jgi:hypothetical protein
MSLSELNHHNFIWDDEDCSVEQEYVVPYQVNKVKSTPISDNILLTNKGGISGLKKHSLTADLAGKDSSKLEEGLITLSKSKTEGKDDDFAAINKKMFEESKLTKEKEAECKCKKGVSDYTKAQRKS